MVLIASRPIGKNLIRIPRTMMVYNSYLNAIMKNSNKQYMAASFIILALSAPTPPLLLSANAVSSESKASAIWSVGSQIFQVSASADNNVHVLWQNNSPDKNVYFRRSTDGEATFDRAMQLSNVTTSSGYAANPKMAISGDNVYVAWLERSGTAATQHSMVLFKRSTDGGATFGDAQILSTNGRGDSGIQQLIALGNNNVYALIIDEWAEGISYYYDSTFRLSKDNGKTFGKSISLLPAPSHMSGGATSMAVSPSGKMVYAVGVDYGDCRPEQSNICDDNASLFFKRSIDGGENFSEAVTIKRPSGIVTKSTSERRAQSPTGVQVAASDNTQVGIAWREYLASVERESIFLAMSNDGGETFEDAMQLDSSLKGSSDAPLLLASSDSTMYVVWNARENNGSMPHIALIRSKGDDTDDRSFGISTSAIMGKKISSIPIWSAAILADNDVVYLVTSNSTKNVSGLPDGVDVYFSANTKGQGSLTSPVDISDDNAIKMFFAAQQKRLYFVNPMLATSGKHVYVGWQAGYPDSHEIFIRTSDDGGSTFGKITILNESAGEPVSRGLAILNSSLDTYTTIAIIGAIIIAGVFGVLIARRRKANGK
jgi:hypothetical protein